MAENPLVSVVIPVYNDPVAIKQCLNALANQTYPAEQYEVIVVDNNSTDNTASVVQNFPVELVFERDIQSSYAARNTGIDTAEGEILAFTDADCTPSEDWIENGVRTMQKQNADIVAGRVKMNFPSGGTAAERFDAQGNMRNDRSVRNGVAKTANLFVKSRVFQEFEPFPDHFISGGDVYWTGSAVERGYELVYGADAVVSHPARGFKELLEKNFRIGRGNVQMWTERGDSPVRVMFGKIARVPSLVTRGKTSDPPSEEVTEPVPPDRHFEPTTAMALVSVCTTLAQNLGRFYGMTIERMD